jgi:hypothetical protein
VREKMTLNDGLYEQLLAAVERRHRRYYLYLGMVIIVLVLMVAYLAWRGKPVSVTPLSQEQARTPAGVQLAADKAFVPLSKPQVQEVAVKIVQAETRPPDRVVASTGKDVVKTVESVRKATKADFAIVTDPQKPQEKPAVKSDEPVNLNVYNIKAYPKKMVEVSAGMHGADIAYLKRVNVPKIPVILPKGTVAYAGPFIRTEYGSGKVDGGVRLVLTF